MSPKINHIGFGAQGRVQKSRNHEHEGFEGSPMTKSNKSKMKQNNSMELVAICFHNFILKIL